MQVGDIDINRVTNLGLIQSVAEYKHPLDCNKGIMMYHGQIQSEEMEHIK